MSRAKGGAWGTNDGGHDHGVCGAAKGQWMDSAEGERQDSLPSLSLSGSLKAQPLCRLAVPLVTLPGLVYRAHPLHTDAVAPTGIHRPVATTMPGQPR